MVANPVTQAEVDKVKDRLIKAGIYPLRAKRKQIAEVANVGDRRARTIREWLQRSILRPEKPAGFTQHLVLPDPHFPFEDKRTWNAVMSYARTQHWDSVIQVGDLGDYDQLSKYSRSSPELLVRPVKDDHDYINEKLDELDDATPGAEKILIEGNHDFRVEQFCRYFPALRGTLDIPTALRIRERGWKWIPFWQTGELYKLGKAYFIHGKYHNKYHAFKHADNYGVNIFYGHTHDTQNYPKTMHGKDKTIIAQSLGCLCDYEQEYLRGTPTNWQQAFAVFRVFSDGFFNHYPVHIFDHTFASPEGEVFIG